MSGPSLKSDDHEMISAKLRRNSNYGEPLEESLEQSSTLRGSMTPPRKLPYSFAEHAWALRHLRTEGITPTAESILEAVEKRRDAIAKGENLTSAAPRSQVTGDVPGTSLVESLAEPYDSIGENAAFAREIIRQEEFLADAREWNHYLLTRVHSLVQEIQALQEKAILFDSRTSEASPEESPVRSNGNAPAVSSSDAVAASSDWEILLKQAEEQRRELEAQVEELKVEHVLNQSLERVIEEQRLSLESSSQRIEALTRQLEEAGHLRVRAEQLHAELLEAKSSLEAYRKRENAWRSAQGEQEALKARADAELHRLRNMLDEQHAELDQVRGESLHYANQIETERSRLQAEQTRSAAIIAQLTRQLEQEREAHRLREMEHRDEVQQLCFQFENDRREFEAAQKRNSETIANLQKQVEELQQIAATARAAAAQNALLIEKERKLEQDALVSASALAGAHQDLAAADTALKESELRAAEARKALDDLRRESEARIARLEATIAELELALASERNQSNERAEKQSEEVEELRKNLRQQTDAAELHKSAINQLESKLKATESELAELRNTPPASLLTSPSIPSLDGGKASSAAPHRQGSRTVFFLLITGIILGGILLFSSFFQSQIAGRATGNEPTVSDAAPPAIQDPDSVPGSATPDTTLQEPQAVSSEIMPAEPPSLQEAALVLPTASTASDSTIAPIPGQVSGNSPIEATTLPLPQIDLEKIRTAWNDSRKNRFNSALGEKRSSINGLAIAQRNAEPHELHTQPQNPVIHADRAFLEELPAVSPNPPMLESTAPYIQTAAPEATTPTAQEDIPSPPFVAESSFTPENAVNPSRQIHGPPMPPALIGPHREFPHFVPVEEVGKE